MRAYVLLAGAILACDSGAPADSAPTDSAPTDSVPAVSVPVLTPDSMVAGEPVVAAEPPTQVATESWLQRYDFDDRLWHVDLPGRLDEVSGLAFDGSGRLLAHDDERARVHVLDPETGDVLGRFDLGEGVVADDFEGVAIGQERHFLISSTGLLYEFRAGEFGEDVEYRRTDSGVGASCEVEGLDVLDGSALLIACKTVSPERGRVELLRLPLDGSPPLPPITLDRQSLRGTEVDTDFAPSGVAVTPSGTIAILSGRHEAIIEIDREGELLHSVELRRGRHPQSEGIAFGPSGTLYIADEKNGQDARLTAYAPSPGGR